MRIISGFVNLNTFKQSKIKEKSLVEVSRTQGKYKRVELIEDFVEKIVFDRGQSKAGHSESWQTTLKGPSKQQRVVLESGEPPPQRKNANQRQWAALGRGGLNLVNHKPLGQLRAFDINEGQLQLPIRLQVKIKLITYLLNAFSDVNIGLAFLKRLLDDNLQVAIKIKRLTHLSNTTPASKFLNRPLAKAGERVAQNRAQIEPSANRVKVEGSKVTLRDEELGFVAEGTVTTSEGAKYDFEVSISLKNTFEDIVDLDEKTKSKFIDPLVVNFEAKSAQMTKKRFEFDLTADGNLENITMPTGGSGFIALDKNGNGLIDNGNELFGVHSGDGFADLAHFDDDQNGFIDENDEVFSQLLIFSKDAKGKDVVFTLKDKNIGAIALDNVETLFNLKEQSSRLRKTGIFIKEDGSASTVQHVDLKT